MANESGSFSRGTALTMKLDVLHKVRQIPLLWVSASRTVLHPRKRGQRKSRLLRHLRHNINQHPGWRLESHGNSTSETSLHLYVVLPVDPIPHPASGPSITTTTTMGPTRHRISDKPGTLVRSPCHHGLHLISTIPIPSVHCRLAACPP